MDPFNKRGETVPSPGLQSVTGDQSPQNANSSNGSPFPRQAVLDQADDSKSPLVMPAPAFNPHDALFRLRMRFPNLQIVPIPSITKTLTLAANAAKDMNLADGTLAVLLFVTGPVWMNADGAAAVPAADGDNQSAMIPMNFPYMLYLQGKRQLSFLAEQAAVVQAWCYIDLPKDSR